MKFSKQFFITTKEIPKDCVLKSHSILVRGGFIKQIGSGIYNILPLGLIILNKITKIIKDEMDKSGANELKLGFITPANLWEESGRLHKYGKELLVFKDRKENPFVLGPTHEEAIVECVSGFVKSYKQLPLNLYQINLKFRDEIRPRFGLLRAREFIMKDAYSFHSSAESLDLEFEKMEQTYKNIFTRLNVDFRVVEADSGAIGGSGSKEFMILAPSGEDDIVVCSNCDYASNIEVAARAKQDAPSPAPQADFAKFYTPEIKNIKDLSEFFKIDSFYLLKCVAKMAIMEDLSKKPAFFFVRGSDELSPTKALNAIDGAIELIDLSALELENLGLFSGFIGPYSLKNITKSELIFFDNELMDAPNLICGANEPNYHFVGVNLGEFSGLIYKDLIEVKAGDKCPKCSGILRITKGIEIGHIFKLGTKYSAPLNANFLDKNGKTQPFIMGCYGIGVSRMLAAILEQKADEKGAIWGNLAPFKIDIIISNINNQNEQNIANKIYEGLLARGIEALLDERDLRFGAKIADFELIGFEFALIIGKSLNENKIELIKRDGLQKMILDSNISIDEICAILGEK